MRYAKVAAALLMIMALTACSNFIKNEEELSLPIIEDTEIITLPEHTPNNERTNVVPESPVMVSEPHYRIVLRSSKDLGVPEALANIFLESHEFIWPEIGGLDDSELQDKINDTLMEAAIGWIKESENPEVRNPPPVIYFFSSRYLSVLNMYCSVYGTSKNLATSFNFYTVDITTGERVMLNDLIEINDDFVALLKSGAIVDDDSGDIRASTRTGTLDWPLDYPESIKNDLLAMSSDAVLSKLQCASEEDFTERVFKERGSFYLEPGKLILAFSNYENYDRIAISLDSIKDFLKVAPW